ncbi:MAG TPA: hypothetical protein VK854_12825 [Woeseiaceae bacterium]|nr:hypothetical protein [Woeseiaceae bacterium]
MLSIHRKSGLSIALGLLLAVSLVWSVDSHSAGHPETRIDGEIAGTAYTLLQPESWNGDLVLLVHGSIPVQFEALAPAFTAQGYGVAFVTLTNSVGTNDGDANRQVTLATRKVQAQFTARFGRPNRTYLVGFSRGGHNMTRLLETSPTRYDGMLSICGSNGGTQQQLDYFFTARVLFDYYFPGVLPGSPLAMPPLTLDDYEDLIVPLVVNAVIGNLGAAIEMASVEQFGLQYSNIGELIEGIVQSLAIHSVTVNGTLDAAHGNPFDNSLVNYTGTSDDAALNAGIVRLIADPQARAYAATWYEPNGSIGGTPVLLLHTSRDPIVLDSPGNDKYEALIEASGNGDFLLRRTVDRFGHCTLTVQEIFGSFADLVTWVETGIRPGQ